MIKRFLALLLGLLLCFGTAAPGFAENTGVTFEDDLGRTVTVDRPERVVVLIGSFAHIWYLAGGLDSLVAAASDTWTSFDIPLDEAVINLGATKQVSLEAVIAANPDFVIASVNTDADLALREPPAGRTGRDSAAAGLRRRTPSDRGAPRRPAWERR